jgi:hypothetical protein
MILKQISLLFQVIVERRDSCFSMGFITIGFRILTDA